MIYGKSFRDHDINYRSTYECELIQEKDHGRKIELRYSGRWNDSNDLINGYAFYEFEVDLNNRKRFTKGIARFMEFGIEAGVSVPVVPGIVRRVEQAAVRTILHKKYPSSDEDYMAVSRLKVG